MMHDESGAPLRACNTCGELFDPRSAKLGAQNCPTCDRRAGRAW